MPAHRRTHRSAHAPAISDATIGLSLGAPLLGALSCAHASPSLPQSTLSQEAANQTALQQEPEAGSLGESLGGPNTLAGLLMAGGVLIITFILMSRLRRKQRNAPPNIPPMEQVEAIRARATNRADIDAYKVDAHDFTRQMAALLDSKAERLEQLILDADDRLARLEAASRPERHAPRAHNDDRPPHAPSRDSHRNDRREADEPRHAPPHDRPAARHPDDQHDTRSDSRSDTRSDTGHDPLHNRVYDLADSGLDPIAIARETGQPTGQIELILALRG